MTIQFENIVIVVLGGDPLYRQPAALRLFFHLKAREIWIIGDPSFYFEGCDKSLVDQIQYYKGQHIFRVYPSSQNTFQDIQMFKNIITCSNKQFKFVVVTSDYHAERVYRVMKSNLTHDELKQIAFVSVHPGRKIIKILGEKLKSLWYKFSYAV